MMLSLQLNIISYQNFGKIRFLISQNPINNIVVTVDVTPDLSKGQVSDQQCPAQGSMGGVIITLQYKDAR